MKEEEKQNLSSLESMYNSKIYDFDVSDWSIEKLVIEGHKKYGSIDDSVVTPFSIMVWVKDKHAFLQKKNFLFFLTR
jgi:hypothetical protein